MGARFDDDNGIDSGAAYLFVRQAGMWKQSDKLLASDGIAGDWLGWHSRGVSVSGSTAIAGAIFHESNAGAAYVFSRTTGFVTGGGWINSPAGAYAADSSLIGKAELAFDVKYKKLQNTLDGNASFLFPAANLYFQSVDLEWLVVDEYRTQARGTGQINGSGDYGFMIFAIDAKLTASTNVDLFRIRIWDRNNNDAIVYDSEPGAGDAADPTISLGGGSIVIH